LAVVYISVGLIGSGKSTWAKAKAQKEPHTVIINKDSLRDMIKGKYIFCKDLEPLIHEWAAYMISIAIQNEYDVIIDEINLTKALRRNLIDIAENNSPRPRIVCVWFTEKNNNVENRLKDNHGDTSKDKWVKIYEHMRSIFEVPQLSERFDEIIKVEI